MSSQGSTPRRRGGRVRGAAMKATATLKTVDRALNIVDFLTTFGGQVGVRELADYLGISKTATHRFLITLERHGYVAQDPVTGKYQLGARLFEAGSVVYREMGLRVVARPHLERLAAETGEVVHLAVLNDGHCVYIDKIAGARAIPMASQIGWRKPLHCTGLGKVLLAFVPEPQARRIITERPLEPLTPNTITDPERLWLELEEIRRTGIGYDREEIEMGLRCVAAPIYAPSGHIIAAISIAGPSERFTSEHLPWLCQKLRATAEAISRDIEADTPSRHPLPTS